MQVEHGATIVVVVILLALALNACEDPALRLTGGPGPTPLGGDAIPPSSQEDQAAVIEVSLLFARDTSGQGRMIIVGARRTFGENKDHPSQGDYFLAVVDGSGKSPLLPLATPDVGPGERAELKVIVPGSTSYLFGEVEVWLFNDQGEKIWSVPLE